MANGFAYQLFITNTAVADLICDEVWSFKLQVTISHISPHPLDSTKGNMTQCRGRFNL